MTLVQKLGILCLPNHERAKTGRRSPFYLNCSQLCPRVPKYLGQIPTNSEKWFDSFFAQRLITHRSRIDQFTNEIQNLLRFWDTLEHKTVLSFSVPTQPILDTLISMPMPDTKWPNLNRLLRLNYSSGCFQPDVREMVLGVWPSGFKCPAPPQP